MTIRKKLLVLLVLATAIPVIVQGLLSYRAADESLGAVVTELHTRSALAEAEFASSYVLSMAGELSAAIPYDDPATWNSEEGRGQAFVDRILLLRDRISIAALLDRAGEIRFADFVDDLESFSRKNPRFSRHDLVAAEELEDFRRRAAALVGALRPEELYAISEPYITRARLKPAVLVLARGPPGRPSNLAVELVLDDLATRLSSGYSGGTRVFLLDREGRAIVDPDAARQRARESYAARLPGAVGTHEPGIAQYVDGGTTFLAAYSPVGGLGWVAVVARPRDEALAPVQMHFRSATLVLAFALLSLGALAPVGARALAEPIAQLARGAVEYGRGNFAYRISLEREDELGELARTFNEMGRSLEEANRKLVRFNEELRRQVEERSGELKRAQQQLLRSQRLAALGDLSAGLAHEVNNPLATIVGNAQLLLERTEHAPERQMLADTLEQALRISSIVQDLQALSDTQRGGLLAVDLRALLERVISTRSEDLASSGIELSATFDSAESRVLANEPALREVFNHLLSNSQNALQGRQERSICVVTSSIDGQAVVVEVSDTGRGIPKEHLERIFNPFFTTKQRWAGKGLALAICHRVIENHGGKISIQSEEDVGTTVTVVLPAAPPQAFLR